MTAAGKLTRSAGGAASLAAALVVLLASCLGAAAGDGASLRGIALVIGNDEYDHLPKLANPTHDARAVEDMLDSLGFETDLAQNRNARHMRRDIDGFVDDVEGADVALLYYSGHGIEAGGENYLLPVDTDAAGLQSADATLIALSPLIARLHEKAPVVIVLVDACRTSPFPAGTVLRALPGAAPAPVDAAGLGVPRGAATLTAPIGGRDDAGTVIGFAAAPGRPALDGPEGGDSPYAAAILKHFAAGQYSFGDVMVMVAEEVYLDTRGQQTPWTNTSLRRQLVFGGNAGSEPTGDEALIRGERRQLLLTIAATPTPLRRMVEQAASSDDVPLAAVYGMLKQLQVEPGSQDQLGQQLAEGAGRLKQILAQRDIETRADPELARLASLAAEAERQGALTAALRFRARASERAEDIATSIDAAERNVRDRRLELAATFAAHADTATLNFDFAVAAERYHEAFLQADTWDADLAAQYRRQEADAQADLGIHHGDLGALQASVGTYRQVLAMAAVASSRRRTADITADMAMALTFIGQRETGTNALERAAAAYAGIADTYDRQADAWGWGVYWLNLGNLYQTLAVRQGTPDAYDKALDAFNNAGLVFTRERAPEQWAGLQMNMGNLASTYGQNTGSARHLADSIGSPSTTR